MIQKQTIHKCLKNRVFWYSSILSLFTNLQQQKNCEAKHLQGVNFQIDDIALLFQISII